MPPFPITRLPDAQRLQLDLRQNQDVVTLTLPRISTTITTIVTLGGSNPTPTPNPNPITTSPNPQSTSPVISGGGGGGTSNSATIGAILGSLIGFLVIMLLLFCCCSNNATFSWPWFAFWRRGGSESSGDSYYSYDDVSEVRVRGGGGERKMAFGVTRPGKVRVGRRRGDAVRVKRTIDERDRGSEKGGGLKGGGGREWGERELGHERDGGLKGGNRGENARNANIRDGGVRGSERDGGLKGGGGGRREWGEKESVRKGSIRGGPTRGGVSERSYRRRSVERRRDGCWGRFLRGNARRERVVERDRHSWAGKREREFDDELEYVDD
ncbi:uncharacterized protein LY89DRAFT_729204 [Mollisia scopiformis]|uniref:Uncharacterized protein n=1 Tax=Mollisia scopiformis TaxID=149040 RepID=A0A194XNF9_MOLSC|nr:uncharacterized protein LY89DRAFT_729204 [Mollisia scopiformis]KUJ21693.1 hypothetical protein LY89DRAFT_729204 [Mollisia scopiformis]